MLSSPATAPSHSEPHAASVPHLKTTLQRLPSGPSKARRTRYLERQRYSLLSKKTKLPFPEKKENCSSIPRLACARHTGKLLGGSGCFESQTPPPRVGPAPPPQPRPVPPPGQARNALSRPGSRALFGLWGAGGGR